MKKLITKLNTGIALLLISSQIVCAKNGPNYPEGFKPKTTTGISFTENKGQVHDQYYQPRPDVLFGAMAGNMAFHLKTTGVSYQLNRIDKFKEVVDERTKEKRKEIDQQTIYRIDLSWLNANKNFVTITDKTIEGYDNYYTEGGPKGGALNVKSYTGVTIHNLYTGINLHYYEKDGQLKHDYIIAPGAIYKQIQVKVEGARVSVNKDGSLTLSTPLGKVQEGAPIVFQNGKQLKAKWNLNNNILSFDIENYNPNQKLIIDPVTRVWGTYYGGSVTDDFGYSCTTDATGNVYLAGSTVSNTGTVIATTGAHQSVSGGSEDAFLVKFNSSGLRQWGTYYGGSANDYGYSCATDATGNVYLAGYTNSNTGTVIATAGAHQSAYGGSVNDAFLVKFNSNGLRQWGTYYGGSEAEYGYSCSTDATGNVYLAGFTNSNIGTIIATAGAHQSVSDGSNDAFLVKFNSSGLRQWGTYYGGSLTDIGYSCSTDATGNVYLAGYTNSNTGTVIATAGAHQSAYGGSQDAFLVKFNSSGLRQWGTYYGGSDGEYGFSCATDALGNVFLAGWTGSNTGTVIATAGAHQSVHGGVIDAFLVKFDAGGVRQWGTYYGGSGQEEGWWCATDATGNVYLPGITTSNTGTVIATAGTHQSVSGGSNDAFLVKFNSSGLRQWGTYYGGSGDERGYSCVSDATGNVYLAGHTNSNTGTVIATAGAHQTMFNGWTAAFIAKFTDCVSLSPNASTSATLCAGTAINLIVTITGTATPTYSWAGPNSFTAGVQNPVIAGAGTIHIGTYTLTVNNSGCIETATTQVSAINALPTVAVNNGTICVGNSVTITPSGASTYTIEGGNTLVSPTANTSYTVIGESASGCLSANTATSMITVNALPFVNAFSSSTTFICVGQSATLTASGANSYTWNPVGIGNSIVINPTVTTNYTVTGVDANGCENTAVISQSVSACSGLNESNYSSLVLIYPNPVNEILNINFGSFDLTDLRIEVMNSIGQIIMVSHVNNTITKLDLTSVINGIYILRVMHDQNQILNYKLIKN